MCCQPPHLRKARARRGSFGEQYGWEKAAVPGPARSEYIGPARAREGKSQQALRSSLLWAMEAGSVVLHLPNQGLGDLVQNQLIEGGERSVSSPCTLLSFGFSGHRVRQMPKEEEAGGDCPVLRTESRPEWRPDLPFRNSLLTNRLLEAGKIKGSYYKMQVFEEVSPHACSMLLFHKHTL